ncbi:MAG: hypothetical protein LBM93_02600 [Oscillospiraceae bacterium]|nr:hypothetical protein [Oscillospiraceae bacterium]
MVQTQTFDNLIKSLVSSKNYSADRLEYYDFLMESYGGHQEFVSPLGATFPG